MNLSGTVENGIGQRVRRKEDVRLLTGRGSFADDIYLPELAHAVIVRSPHAHTRILDPSTKPQRSRLRACSPCSPAATMSAMALPRSRTTLGSWPPVWDSPNVHRGGMTSLLRHPRPAQAGEESDFEQGEGLWDRQICGGGLQSGDA